MTSLPGSQPPHLHLDNTYLKGSWWGRVKSMNGLSRHLLAWVLCKIRKHRSINKQRGHWGLGAICPVIYPTISIYLYNIKYKNICTAIAFLRLKAKYQIGRNLIICKPVWDVIWLSMFEWIIRINTRIHKLLYIYLIKFIYCLCFRKKKTYMRLLIVTLLIINVRNKYS